MVAHGAEVDATDSRGDTALHRAAYFGRKDVVALLLGHGAGVNAQNKDGFTALRMAKLEGETQTAELLRRSGGHE
jgi:ankyrin repeat protein